MGKLRAQLKIARRRKLLLSKGVVPFGSDPMDDPMDLTMDLSTAAMVSAFAWGPHFAAV